MPSETVVIKISGSDDTGAAWASANRRVSRHRKLVKSLTHSYGGMKKHIVQINSALGALPVAGLAGVTAGVAILGKGVVQSSLAYDRFVNSITAVTGSAKAGNVEFKALVKTADELGLNLDQTADSYKGFFAASVNKGVSISDTRLMFRGIAKNIAVMGLTAEQTGRVMQGFSQIMSKGTLSAEELKQQIGESLPTAMGDAATSMKMSMDDFLKAMGNGLIDGVEFMKIYTNYVNQKYSPSVAKALIKTQGQINLMSNRWSALKRNMADAGFVEVVTKAVTRITDVLGDPVTIEYMKSFVTTLSKFFTEVIENGAQATRLLKGIALALLPLGPQFKLLMVAMTGAKEAMVELTGSAEPLFFRFLNAAKIAKVEDNIRGVKKEIVDLTKKIADGGTVYDLGFTKITHITQSAEDQKIALKGLNDELVEYQKQLNKLNGVKPALGVVKGDVVDPRKPDELVKTSNPIKGKAVGTLPKELIVGGEAVKSFREELLLMAGDFTNLQTVGLDFIGSFSDGLANQLTEALMTGKMSFGEFARSILAMITQMIVKMLIFNAIAGIAESFAGGGGTKAASSRLKMNPGAPSFTAFAGGGSVSGGQPIMVGEAGREVFVPDSNGTIVPNYNVKSAKATSEPSAETVNITLNLSTGVQSTVRAEVMGMMPIITKQVKNAVADARQRGGSFSSSMGVA